jgi:predicted transcriptional regulator
MRLYPLLKDRASINILKILYDNEFGNEKKHTMHYSELKSKLLIKDGVSTLPNLIDAGLISTDNGNSGVVLSITQRGKEFVEQFDKLVFIVNGKKQEQKAYQVKYELTALEQRILLLCSKIKSETGKSVDLKTLTQEVYPYKEPESKKGTVSKYAKKLEELNLIKKVKSNNRTFFDITESGEKTIREQFIESEAIKQNGFL